VYKGLLVDSLPDWSIRMEEGILVVRGESIIRRAKLDELDDILAEFDLIREDITELTGTQFILPGLIDTHIHASQFPNAGLALELPLLEWLEKYTFPTESMFSKTDYSNQVYERCVRSTIDSGTTTAVYFATIHKESSENLALVCKKLGQRAFVGKVCMDRNSPDYYVEETEESLNNTRKFINQVEKVGGSLVSPIITPRFVPSCSRTLMENLGELAKERNLAVQTHISENKKEVEWVRNLEPDCDSYTQVYEKCNLLGSRTILAHGIHLSDQELSVIRETDSGISHCPNSNFSLKSGVCDVRRLKNHHVKVGLGTDCSGGYSPSLLNSMRLTVLASNTQKFSREDGEDYEALDYADAIYLATRGGARLLDMEERLGSLDTGKLADFILVDMKGQKTTIPFGHETFQDLVHKFVFLGDDRNVIKVVVNGKEVKDVRLSHRG